LVSLQDQRSRDGSWRGAGRETRETLEVIAQRSVKKNSAIDERKTIARICEDEAQQVAEEKAALENLPKL